MGAKYDQHFLADPAAADAIVRAAGARPGAAVVEIGPGRGALTELLLSAGAAVTAVEVDPRLAQTLTARLGDKALKVLNADFLHVDLSSLPSPCTVVSNLPYSVGTPITLRLLGWPAWETAVLMFQKEVAERVVAEPGGRDYGLLTLAVRAWADAELLLAVPRTNFRPPPKVDAGVVRLTRLAKSRLPEGLTPAEFARVTKAAFAQRRKMASKSLAAGLSLPRAAVDAAFAACGLDLSARAEVIGYEGFAALALALRKASPC